MSELRQPPAIEAYGAGGFRVEGVRFEGSVVILADEVTSWSGQLEAGDLDAVIAAGPGVVELLILGMGRALAPPPRQLRQAVRDAGIGLEVMTTSEAVRLYNLLASDGRRVAAALIAV